MAGLQVRRREAGAPKRRKQVRKRETTSLLGLLAADQREYGPTEARNWRSSQHWSAAESRLIECYARAVLAGRYANAVLAVGDCRAALSRLAAAGTSRGLLPPTRTRQAVHAMLVKAALRQGRTPSRVRWTREETALLDRFAAAVAQNRFRTARGAGPACREAISRLHRRFPGRYAGFPERSLSTIQHGIWPRVARLKYRWFNSQWFASEIAIVDRYARAVIAHRFPSVRAASKACSRAINLMHARVAQRRGRRRPGVVRTVSAVSDRVLTRAKEIAPYQLPNRRWTATERRIAARWARRYDQHMRGKLTMNLLTIAALLQAELGRRGYYRNVQACVTEIVTQRRRDVLGLTR